MTRRNLTLAAIALLSVAAVGAALLLQHQHGMQPCPWCILQRLVFVLMALVALLGLAWPGRVGTVVATAGLSTLALAGMAAALWQHFVAASSASCDLTLAERIVSALGLDQRWPEVFTAYASCKDAAVNLLGVPFEFWSLALFVVLDTAAISLLLGLRRSAR